MTDKRHAKQLQNYSHLPPLACFKYEKPRAFLPELFDNYGFWFRVWLCPVRCAIDIVSLAYPPHRSGYEPDEVRAYRNRLLIDFSSNGLIPDSLTRLLEWRLDRGFIVFWRFGCGGRI